MKSDKSIRKSDLVMLIQEITRRIVNEIDKKKLKELTATPAASPVTGPTPFKNKNGDDTIDEMTTTSAVSVYNTPRAFTNTNTMNRKGRIEVLGYKMTPDGEKEYNRPGDRKL